VYGFTGTPDGAKPQAALININGTLYGTTADGGSPDRCSNGCGTAFSVTPAGREAVVYRFANTDGLSNNGTNPTASLLDVKGNFFSTTSSGLNGGTMYRVSPSGTEKVLWSFVCGDGSPCVPSSSLVDIGGTFYGTSFTGGLETRICGHYRSVCGTVFSNTRRGYPVEEIVSFHNPKTGHPAARLLFVKELGTLFGTTSGGTDGYGGVFKTPLPWQAVAGHVRSTGRRGPHGAGPFPRAAGHLPRLVRRSPCDACAGRLR
jgi:uncharacterized repeat protein (TIGR03803 family)